MSPRRERPVPGPTSAAYAPFRPRRSRVVSIVASLGILIGFTVGALSVPRGGRFGWTLLDTLMMIAFGGAIAAFVIRYAFIRADPSPQGLVVRNLFRVTHLEWSQILGAQFGGGQPWLMLDLADTEQLAVMAIQRSDGARSLEEAGRMAALIEAHAFPGRPDAG